MTPPLINEKSTESTEFDWLKALRAAQSNSQSQTVEPFAENTDIELDFEGPQPLLDESELEPDPDTGRFAFVPNRAAKLGLMAVGAIAVVGVGWYTSFGSAKTPQTESASSPSDSVVESGENEQVAQLEQENDDLKAERALGEQDRQLKDLKSGSPPAKTPPRPTSSQPVVVRRSPPPTERPVRSVTPPPPPVIEPNPPRVRRTPLREPLSVTRPVPPPPRQTMPVPLAASVSAWQDNSDPQEAQQTWLMAARLGSYGGDSGEGAEVPVEASQTVGSGDTEYYGTDAIDEVPVHFAAADDSLVPLSRTRTSAPEIDLERSVLEGRPLSLLELPVGTKVTGRLLNAIVWDDPQLVEGSQVTVELSEDLRDRSGQVLIPAGEPVTAQIVQARASGIVLLSVEELPSAEGPIPLKSGTIVVQQPDGMPLVAERRPQGNEEGGGIDLGSLTLDVLGVVTPLLGGGGNGDGFYRDAYQLDRFENLYEQHFQQRQDPYATRSRVREAAIWQLPAGTEVELRVREPIKIYQ